jgi:hypothetical protein
MLGLVSASACRTEVTYESPLIVSFPENQLLDRICIPEGGLDTLILDLYSIDVGTLTPREACLSCGTRPETHCKRLQRVCKCGGPRYDATGLIAALGGASLENLDPALQYCARLTVLVRTEDKTGATVGPAATCGPTVSECSSAIDPNRVEICALTDAFGVSESKTPVVLSAVNCKGIDDFLAPHQERDGGIDINCVRFPALCRDAGVTNAGDQKTISTKECATF